MALLGQSRDSWPSMTPLGHVELTKVQKNLESKNQNENEKQNENKNEISFLVLFLFFIFVFVFIFIYVFVFIFVFFLFPFSFLFLFSFLFFFYFLVFIFKFYYGTSRPPYWCTLLYWIAMSGHFAESLTMVPRHLSRGKLPPC